MELKVPKYRAVLGAILSRHGDPNLHKRLTEEYYDAMQGHSTTTALLKYGVHFEELENADPRHVRGCIQTSIMWHDLIQITNGRRLQAIVDKDPLDLGPRTPSELSSSFANLSQTDIVRLANAIVDAGRVRQETTTRTAISDALTEITPLYFGKPSTARPPEALRQQSTINVHPSFLIQLRAFLGNNSASFRSPEQAELVAKMHARKNHILT